MAYHSLALRNFTPCIFSFFFVTLLSGQIVLTPSDSVGSGYEAVLNSGLELETPDCVHDDFGPHVTQTYDGLLKKNVFEFHSHIQEDNDRCQVFDRVRMEIKGGPNSDLEARHPLGSESFYRWKFRVDPDFVGTSSFCHIFQNKIKGGSDDGLPIITLTLRKAVLEVRHRGGNSGQDLGNLLEMDLAQIRGKWIEVYLYQLHREEGVLEIELVDLQSGEMIGSYSNDEIDLWRPGADYSRPKWGIYRAKSDVLQDEIVRFADFCISELSAELCPADTFRIVDNEPPSVPSGLRIGKVSMTSAEVSWDNATDNTGIKTYKLYNKDTLFTEVISNSIFLENLIPEEEYLVAVSAVDATGNESARSEVVSFVTDSLNALPGEPSNPFPADDANWMGSSVLLSWDLGENTDSSIIYIGLEPTLQEMARTAGNEYELELEADRVYYWQVGQKNLNGTTLGPVWFFTTSSNSGDIPWLVFRADDRPDLVTNFLELVDVPEVPEVDTIKDDPIVNGNRFYQYYEEGEEKFRWRYSFSEKDTAITVVARIKGLEYSNNLAYFEVRMNGFREKLRINHNTFKLEKSSPNVESDIDFDFDQSFHLVRITYSNRTMRVYLDEHEEVFVQGFSVEPDGNSNFDFGKSGGTPAGCFVDWLMILPNRSVRPGEGPELPEDLILSNSADLQSILVDGTPLPNFQPEKYQYDIKIESGLIPSLEFLPASKFALINIKDIADESGYGLKVTVEAQDSVTEQTYEIRFTETSSIDEVEEDQIRIFPNPSGGIVYIQLDRSKINRVLIYDLAGIRIDCPIKLDKFGASIHLKPGVFLARIELENGSYLSKKLIVKK